MKTGTPQHLENIASLSDNDFDKMLRTMSVWSTLMILASVTIIVMFAIALIAATQLLEKYAFILAAISLPFACTSIYILARTTMNRTHDFRILRKVLSDPKTGRLTSSLPDASRN